MDAIFLFVYQTFRYDPVIRKMVTEMYDVYIAIDFRIMFASKSLVLLTISTLNLLDMQVMHKGLCQEKPSILRIYNRIYFHVSFQSSV